MAASRKPPPVPAELALLYEFANSLDLRRFMHDGVQHETKDSFASAAELEAWMQRNGLLRKGSSLNRSDHRKALELRDALRGFLGLDPADEGRRDAAASLNASAVNFPLAVQVLEDGGVVLQPQPHGSLSGLGKILADLAHAAETGGLDRLKMCASDECRWVFYDRSKPATRRWCSSALCGNRQKTRAYRTRQRQSSAKA